jgi:RNA polymerase sigma factor (sigma-70 family)
LAQEALLRAHASGAEIRHPKAFLRRVADNVARDEHRRLMRRGGGAALRLEDVDYDPALAVAADQHAALLLKQVILRMPDLYRDAFVLTRFQGLTYEEVADRLGVSVKTVEWRISKALAYCAQQLRD